MLLLACADPTPDSEPAPTEETGSETPWSPPVVVVNELMAASAGSLEPGAFLLLHASGRPELGSDHLDFELAAAGALLLSNAPAVPIDRLA